MEFIVDKAFGAAIKTENVTYEQQLKMAESSISLLSVNIF